MEQIAQEVAPLLRELATQLGTTGEHLWSVLVGQAAVEAYMAKIALKKKKVRNFFSGENPQRKGFLKRRLRSLPNFLTGFILFALLRDNWLIFLRLLIRI